MKKSERAKKTGIFFGKENQQLQSRLKLIADAIAIPG